MIRKGDFVTLHYILSLFSNYLITSRLPLSHTPPDLTFIKRCHGPSGAWYPTFNEPGGYHRRVFWYCSFPYYYYYCFCCYYWTCYFCCFCCGVMVVGLHLEGSEGGLPTLAPQLLQLHALHWGEGETTPTEWDEVAPGAAAAAA